MSTDAKTPYLSQKQTTHIPWWYWDYYVVYIASLGNQLGACTRTLPLQLVINHLIVAVLAVMLAPLYHV